MEVLGTGVTGASGCDGVPSAHVGVRLPCKVVRDLRAVCKHVVVLIFLIPCKGALEPGVLVSGVVQDVVHVDVYVLCGGLVYEFLELGFGLGGCCTLSTVDGLDGVVILDVVGVVGLRVVHRA